MSRSKSNLSWLLGAAVSAGISGAGISAYAANTPPASDLSDNGIIDDSNTNSSTKDVPSIAPDAPASYSPPPAAKDPVSAPVVEPPVAQAPSPARTQTPPAAQLDIAPEAASATTYTFTPSLYLPVMEIGQPWHAEVKVGHLEGVSYDCALDTQVAKVWKGLRVSTLSDGSGCALDADSDTSFGRHGFRPTHHYGVTVNVQDPVSHISLASHLFDMKAVAAKKEVVAQAPVPAPVVEPAVAPGETAPVQPVAPTLAVDAAPVEPAAPAVVPKATIITTSLADIVIGKWPWKEFVQVYSDEIYTCHIVWRLTNLDGIQIYKGNQGCELWGDHVWPHGPPGVEVPLNEGTKYDLTVSVDKVNVLRGSTEDESNVSLASRTYHIGLVHAPVRVPAVVAAPAAAETPAEQPAPVEPAAPAAVPLVPDNEKPTVTMTVNPEQPDSNTIFTIASHAADNVGVAAHSLYVNISEPGKKIRDDNVECQANLDCSTTIGPFAVGTTIKYFGQASDASSNYSDSNSDSRVRTITITAAPAVSPAPTGLDAKVAESEQSGKAAEKAKDETATTSSLYLFSVEADAGLRYMNDLPHVMPSLRLGVGRTVADSLHLSLGYDFRFGQKLNAAQVNTTDTSAPGYETVACEGENMCNTPVVRVTQGTTSKQGLARDNTTDIGGPYVGADYTPFHPSARWDAGFFADLRLNVQKSASRSETNTTEAENIVYERNGEVVRALDLNQSSTSHNAAQRTTWTGAFEVDAGIVARYHASEHTHVTFHAAPTYDARRHVFGAVLSVGFNGDVTYTPTAAPNTASDKEAPP